MQALSHHQYTNGGGGSNGSDSDSGSGGGMYALWASDGTTTVIFLTTQSYTFIDRQRETHIQRQTRIDRHIEDIHK